MIDSTLFPGVLRGGIRTAAIQSFWKKWPVLRLSSYGLNLLGDLKSTNQIQVGFISPNPKSHKKQTIKPFTP